MADFPCEICGQPIDPERLLFVPLTRLCTDHARMIAKYGDEFITTTRGIKGSKDSSLKGNIIGVDITHARNEKAMRKLKAELEIPVDFVEPDEEDYGW